MNSKKAEKEKKPEQTKKSEQTKKPKKKTEDKKGYILFIRRGEYTEAGEWHSGDTTTWEGYDTKEETEKKAREFILEQLYHVLRTFKLHNKKISEAMEWGFNFEDYFIFGKNENIYLKDKTISTEQLYKLLTYKLDGVQFEYEIKTLKEHNEEMEELFRKERLKNKKEDRERFTSDKEGGKEEDEFIQCYPVDLGEEGEYLLTIGEDYEPEEDEKKIKLFKK